VAFSQILRIGKYNRLGSIGLYAGTATAAGVLLGVTEREYDGERVFPVTTLLTLLGATLVYNGLDALVYPVRKVNGSDATWRLKTAR
jgi:hypothetical protein